MKFINLSLFEGTSGILQFGATTELVSFESLLIKPGPEKLNKKLKNNKIPHCVLVSSRFSYFQNLSW